MSHRTRVAGGASVTSLEQVPLPAAIGGAPLTPVARPVEDDVRALARYAVIAGAVLPFLPNGPYGPLVAWNPQQLWLVVELVGCTTTLLALNDAE